MSYSASSESSEPLDRTQEEPIPLGSRIVHKFFEPIILLVALIDAVKHAAKPPPPEPPVDVKDPKQLFCAFVNKLGHVCDSEKGGDTVTSFVILKDESMSGRAQYVFAANRQTDSQLQATAAYVKMLLHKVSQAPEGQLNQHYARGSLLYHILRFNRPRVSIYLRELRSQAQLCLQKCQADRTDENRALEDRIAGFRSMECWSEFLHTMRRILAYPQSIQFFFLAKKQWPDLFRQVRVSFIASSCPISKPIRNKSLTADGIVGRMTRKEEEIEIFRGFARALQAFDLDDRIKEEYRKSSFRPIVHSEVLLLNWIANQGQIASSRFFNDWMYIGGSKPMCKLCDYYFQEHRTGVEHRASHGNLYPSWRVPDVFPYQGKGASEARQVMVDKVLRRVRRDAFDIVRKKALPSVKGDDSNTFSAGVTLEEMWSLHGSDADVDDIASLLGQVDIG
ncbi:hypothetical protein Trco_008340 [Trichoderma cornu-damae]|uniref:C2H2-type domain-containing protein n=1 Tax=Trichoderma cornu-damae TaxID=654480 RepID=A0A9P8QF94_9HYPO|nr:hypothetical protein Trco_008340 [Trichoderma cornu-damae]